MPKEGVTYPYVEEYFSKLKTPPVTPVEKLGEKCREENFPVIEPEVEKLLEILLRLKKPSNILEIGTCVGFSSLLMSEICPDAKIVTLERNPVMYEQAEKNFAEFSAKNITLLKGDATKILPTLEGPFDFIFIDAAKGQYPLFLSEADRMLVDDGVIVADNVLFNGMVASGIPDIRRNKTIMGRLDSFLHTAKSDRRFRTAVLSVGDGVSVSYKLKKQSETEE